MPKRRVGRPHEPGRQADVYALGALLHELLTGWPPFAGATPLDILEQGKGQDPVPVRRVQPRVPRDLETICLACLHTDPQRRYGTAAALAEDLQRFLEGKPIRARPVRAWQRGVKWARRQPLRASLLGVVVVTVIGVVAAAWWGTRKQADSERTVVAALHESAAFQGQQKWQEALAAARQAQALLDGSLFENDTLRGQIQAQLADVQLVLALEEARLRKTGVDVRRHRFDARRAVDGYRQALASYGVSVGGVGPDESGARIGARPGPVREAIITALDDWLTLSGSAGKPAERQWLRRALRAADRTGTGASVCAMPERTTT